MMKSYGLMYSKVNQGAIKDTKDIQFSPIYK